MKEKKSYTDGMADVFELTLKVFDELTDAYDLLQQVADHQANILVLAERKYYTKQLALIAVLQTRFENRYWDAIDERKRDNCDQL